jgi:hypothetical protein
MGLRSFAGGARVNQSAASSAQVDDQHERVARTSSSGLIGVAFTSTPNVAQASQTALTIAAGGDGAAFAAPFAAERVEQRRRVLVNDLASPGYRRRSAGHNSSASR